MYCRADVHFIVFYLLALRDASSKVLRCKVDFQTNSAEHID